MFDIDETGLQHNNRPKLVIAEKGSKNIDALTSGEHGKRLPLFDVLMLTELQFRLLVCLRENIINSSEGSNSTWFRYLHIREI